MLRHLRENVEGQPISVILTDPAGVVLARLTADHDLERHLDSVKLAPGFSYAEELVGTNGIGTALEGGQNTKKVQTGFTIITKDNIDGDGGAAAYKSNC